ncbi:hypothetical protein yc1106_05039 [Curvularia clavata]|uniref:Uncharacterized protein n=1 Tax=Curvularia clavata TaxID=95742 RepID=A0A9Q8Z9R9_CURCL|nr:hypothetical protein yc1106_05039 [Curvularia clavata]
MGSGFELTIPNSGVRGTVRDLDSDRASWMPNHFEKRYGTGKFEMVEVRNMESEGCFETAIKGCSGVIHVASVTGFESDPNKIITPSIAFVENILAAAENEPSVSRFVLTSSSAAASQDRINEVYNLTPAMWANWAVEEAWAPPPFTVERARANYYASKVLSEQRLWKYVQERNPRFVANSVLPDFVIGLGVDPERQGFVSSMGLFKQMFDNSGNAWRSFGPQWCVDEVDVALLHIAGLLCPHASNQRIFAYAHRKTWSDFITKLQKMYPNHRFPEPSPHEGQDLSNVTGRGSARNLLKWMGNSDWKPLDESLKEVSDFIVQNQAVA